MGIFKIDVAPDKLKQMEQQIEERLKQRREEHGDYIARENELAAPVVNYSDVEMEKISYELFKARDYVRIFPDEDFLAPKRTSRMKRFFQRVVRRVLRQQIVFNEFILGAMEDLNSRIVKLEEKNRSLQGDKRDMGTRKDDG